MSFCDTNSIEIAHQEVLLKDPISLEFEVSEFVYSCLAFYSSGQCTL